MSQSSDFRDAAETAQAVYEVIGKSGRTYVFFFFPDGSVCAAQREASRNGASAKLNFEVKIKPALRDCGVVAFGATYQESKLLLNQLAKAGPPGSDRERGS